MLSLPQPMLTLPQPILTLPQLADAVKAAPMPLPLKEQILDQVVGHHDDLHRPRRMRRAATPMADRVGRARDGGEFRFRRVSASGDAVFAYLKPDGTAYEVVVRDGHPTSCQCRDFELESLLTPGYHCKHMNLWLEDVWEGEPVDVDEAIALAATGAAEWETAWAHHALGRITDEEANAAYACYEAARSAMRDVIKSQSGRGEAN